MAQKILQHFIRHRYLYTVLAFIILSGSSFNNLPYGDDNIFVFDSWIGGVPNVLDFWNPYTNSFKSWPLPYTVFSLMLKSVGKEVWVYRLLNVVIHISNAFLLLQLFKTWRPNSAKNEKYLLFTLFLVHPIAFITFNWVFQLKTLLCMFFSLITLLCIENAKKSATKWFFPGVVAFFLALTSKIASVLLPFYLLAQFKVFKSKKIFAAMTIVFFSMSTIYGLINIKGINSFFKERRVSEQPVTDYGIDFEKVKTPKPFEPSNYYLVSLRSQLLESVESLRESFDQSLDIKLKLVMATYTLGRYIASSLGLNRYSLVYEPNWASLSPQVIIPFSVLSFLFLFFFYQKTRRRELLLLLIFFIPVSGFFYVPYMKFSYISDHWFYMALPFMLSFFIVDRNKKMQIGLSALIAIQFLFVSMDFSSTERITRKSLERYNNPFLYSYLIEDAEKAQNYEEAYRLTGLYSQAKGTKDELSTKTKFRLNIEQLRNENLPDDFRDFLDYSIAKEDFEVALKFLQRYRALLPSREANLYHLLITGSAKVAGEGENQLATRIFEN